MDELVVQGEISSHIFTLRGKQVMLDRDLAELYHVKAIRLREQVKRNSKRFPDDFMFQLIEDEVKIMVSQNAIPSKQLIEIDRKHDKQYKELRKSLDELVASSKVVDEKVMGFLK